MFPAERYEPHGWFWVIQIPKRTHLYGSFLMDDFGNAIEFTYDLACQRQESIRSYIF